MAIAIDEKVPPFGPGDKLTRAEFLRRWEAHPEVKRAELIGGIVYMPSPDCQPPGTVAGWPLSRGPS